MEPKVVVELILYSKRLINSKTMYYIHHWDGRFVVHSFRMMNASYFPIDHALRFIEKLGVTNFEY